MAKSDNPFETSDSKTFGGTDDTAAEVPAEPAPVEEPKTKPEKVARRTKEEKLADDIGEAVELLLNQGYAVTEATEVTEEKAAPAEVDFSQVPYEAYPLSAVSGQISGILKHNGAAVVLELSLTRWVGEPPISIPAKDMGSIDEVLSTLRQAASGKIEPSA